MRRRLALVVVAVVPVAVLGGIGHALMEEPLVERTGNAATTEFFKVSEDALFPALADTPTAATTRRLRTLNPMTRNRSNPLTI